MRRVRHRLRGPFAWGEEAEHSGKRMPCLYRLLAAGMPPRYSTPCLALAPGIWEEAPKSAGGVWGGVHAWLGWCTTLCGTEVGAASTPLGRPRPSLEAAMVWTRSTSLWYAQMFYQSCFKLRGSSAFRSQLCWGELISFLTEYIA